jgi:hypothetical protein
VIKFAHPLESYELVGLSCSIQMGSVSTSIILIHMAKTAAHVGRNDIHLRGRNSEHEGDAIALP